MKELSKWFLSAKLLEESEKYFSDMEKKVWNEYNRYNEESKNPRPQKTWEGIRG